MPHIVEDRVLETSTGTGTGALTLATAVTGYRRFRDVCATNDTLPYFIEGVDGSGVPTGEWETGIGTYSATDTLTRTTVIRSSNSNVAVNFSAGTKRVGIGLLSISQKWTQIATASPVGVSTVDFTDIPSNYSDLLVRLDGVSHNNGSSAAIQVAVSANGVNYTGGTNISTTASQAGTFYGAVYIPLYRANSGLLLASVANLLSAPGQAGSSAGITWRLPGAMTAVRLLPGAGAFDAGTLTLYGR